MHFHNQVAKTGHGALVTQGRKKRAQVSKEMKKDVMQGSGNFDKTLNRGRKNLMK